MAISFSDIPAFVIKKAPVQWELELLAGFGTPFGWGGVSIPPITIGCLPLFEAIGAKFLHSPKNFENLMDILRPAYIAVQRERCVADVFEHRKFHESLESEFSVDDHATWSMFDFKVGKFFAKLSPSAFDAGKVLELWDFFNASFSGYSMIHGGKPADASAWLYGMDTVAGYLRSLGACVNESLFDMTWRVPLALGSHMIAQAARGNPDVKVFRPDDKGHIDRIREYAVKTELSGDLLFWQKMYPENYELSQVQLAKNSRLFDEYKKLREDVGRLSPEDRKARALEIFEKEKVD